MRYFFAEQDRTLRDAISVRGVDVKNGPRHIISHSDVDSLPQYSFYYLNQSSGETLQDFYQSPVPFVSKRMMEVISMYEEECLFKNVYLVDYSMKSMWAYFFIIAPLRDVLSDHVERFSDGREKQVILDAMRTEGHHIFYLKNSLSRRPVVSLAVVESLLRRGVSGIKFEELEVI